MAKETIKLKKYVDVIMEFEASGTITPGMLLKIHTDGTVRAHATAGGNATKMFALEDELQGNGIDDNYSSGDKVQVMLGRPGDVVNALLKDDETVTIGEYLESDGEGRVQGHDGDYADSGTATVQNAIVGIALEAITAGAYGSGSESSAGGEYHNPRIRMMIV